MDPTTNALVYLVVIVVAMYLLIVRPNQQRNRQMRELMASLAPGKRVVTAGGIYGTVRRVGEDTVDIEIAPGVVIELAKAAVGQIVEDEAVDA